MTTNFNQQIIQTKEKRTGQSATRETGQNQNQHNNTPPKLLANKSEDEGKSNGTSKQLLAAHTHPQQKQKQKAWPTPYEKGKQHLNNKHTTLTLTRPRPQTACPCQRRSKTIILPGTLINCMPAKTERILCLQHQPNKQICVASGLDTTQANMTPRQNTSLLLWPVHKRSKYTQHTPRSHTIKPSQSNKTLHRRFTRLLRSS